jgi:hypothetical protein
MKIVNRQTFLSLPAGTLFSKYNPSCMEHLEIKEESMPNDYFYTPIMDAIDASSSSERLDRLLAMQHDGASFPVDMQQGCRDGCFDADQLFAVWERADAEALLKRLHLALADGYSGGG